MATVKGNMLIGQSGGPTVVINQSLVGAVLEALKHPEIEKIYGARHGMKGILEEDFVDLRQESLETLEAVAMTPASALGSARKKPSPEECARVFEILKKYNIRYYFYIGGNDSAESANIVNENAMQVGYDLRCYHIPKTIDNDLCENDHTPGFGSAAKFVACASMGDNLDSRALPGVKINVIMGRHAGFLTAATALARVYPDDGPHLIYMPERPFVIERFVEDIEKVHARLGRCIVAVSEGIADEQGQAIASKFNKEVDSHGNAQLSGSGALGDLLAGEVKARTKLTRVRADTFGYLQRSFPGITSLVDAKEARKVGMLAVKHAVAKKPNGSIAILRKPGEKYQAVFKRVPLASVAKVTRHMPDEFIAAAGNDVTDAFLAYARPLAGPLPKIGRLQAVPAAKSV